MACEAEQQALADAQAALPGLEQDAENAADLAAASALIAAIDEALAEAAQQALMEGQDAVASAQQALDDCLANQNEQMRAAKPSRANRRVECYRRIKLSIVRELQAFRDGN